MRRRTTHIPVNPPRTETARGDSLLTARVSTYRDRDFVTPFTLKTVLSGRARYETDDGIHLVEPGDLLVLRRGQRYTLSIDEPTETLALFLSPDLVPSHLAIAEGRYSAIHTTGNLLRDLQRSWSRHGTHAELDSWRLQRALRTLALESNQAAARLGVGDHASRDLHARLRLARDYLHARYQSPLQIREAADVACLSISHFHRCYRLLFGRTPLRDLEERRFAVGERLLRTTDLAIAEIVKAIGYESTPSFSTRFRVRTGQSPSSWRRSRQVSDS